LKKPKPWNPSVRDFERAYDRALALKENGVDMTPEKWADVIEGAREFVASLNTNGWTFSTFANHGDLPQEDLELGELSMAFVAAEKIARNSDDPHWVMAKMLLKALDSLEGASVGRG
jgi:hypothetical protein